MCFALVGETLYIAIDEKPKQGDIRRLRRLRNIAENPRVALVADVYDDADWSRLGFVLVHARGRIISEPAVAHEAGPLPARENASAPNVADTHARKHDQTPIRAPDEQAPEPDNSPAANQSEPEHDHAPNSPDEQATVPRRDERVEALRALRDKYPQYRAMALEERPLIAADIESVTAWGRLDAPDPPTLRRSTPPTH